MTKFDDKKVLITGAASGIGRSLAILSAKKGAKLVLTDINQEGLDALARELGPAKVLAHRAFDITDREAVAAFASEVHAAHGSVDIVVNNAGIAIWGTIDRFPHSEWRRLIEVNLMGPVHVLELFVPPMMEARRGGHIVNISSAAGLFGLPWHAAYSATKFGLHGISEVLRFDLERYRIKVSVVFPGAVDTGLVETVRVVGADPNEPSYRKLKQRFQRHAVTPDVAAERIVRGVEKNRYHIFTSPDIAVGGFFKRHFELPYRVVMRHLNRSFEKVAINQRLMDR